MTAIIAILNKSAAALAADSAVSVGSGSRRKVYNYANKIFNLSIGNPIGIMIYNNAEFGGVPWETIIKMFRTHMGNRKHDQVSGYLNDFIDYLKYYIKYVDPHEEESVIEDGVLEYLLSMEKSLVDFAGTIYEEDEFAALPVNQKVEFLTKTLSALVKRDLAEINKFNFCPGFEEQDKLYVKDKYESFIRERIKDFFIAYQIPEDGELSETFFQSILETFVRQVFFESWSGLVFTGFGELEIFPSNYSIRVSGIINNKVRYSDAEQNAINHENIASISPYAQTDIMQTFIEGIDPTVKESLPELFESALIQYKEHILKHIDESSEDEKNLKKVIEEAIPETVNSILKNLEIAREENHINQMLLTISSLSKEDLTALAESLINSTSLHRRASFSEESVGGPVDVAVITKGDGFIWIKRKHYFDSALNLNYLSKNYPRSI